MCVKFVLKEQLLCKRPYLIIGLEYPSYFNIYNCIIYLQSYPD